MSSKILRFFSVVVLVLIAGLPADASAQERLEVPPDTPEYFVQRYERFISEKASVLRDLGKNLNKSAKELSELQSRRIKLEKELVKKKQQKNKTGKIEKNIAKIDAQISSLTPKVEKMKSEIEPMIADFWANYYPDPDPATPENERKQLIDERINNIAQEIFFSSPETPSLLFGHNGGFRGDMAWVYLLHGSPGEENIPGFRSVMSENAMFTDLMLWLYMDQENQNIRFAFLFYQKGVGVYQLFPQDNYKMDICGAVNEIMKFRSMGYRGCTDEINVAFQQLQGESASDGTPGYLYSWALTNFSSNPEILQRRALDPPPSVSEIAKKSNSRVVGEPALLSNEEKSSRFILSGYNSMIPAEFNKDSFIISIARKNLDWAIVESDPPSPTATDGQGKIKTELKIRLIIESLDDRKFKPGIIETQFTKVIARSSLMDNPNGKIVIPLLPEFSSLPPGNYVVNIYIKNILTNDSGSYVSNKYAAWSEKIGIK